MKHHFSSRRRAVKTLAMLVAFSLGSIAYSQKLVDELHSGGRPLLRPSDLLAFESRVSRSDLPCTVAPIKPELGFDFLFHSGFQVTIPFKTLNLAGRGNDLTVLFRVVGSIRPEAPVYMSQQIRLSSGNAMEKGVGSFVGAFVLGEGRYHVDWLMRDGEEHTCTASWDLEAKLAGKELTLRPWTPPALIRPAEINIFREEPPVPAERPSDVLNLDIIVNFAPRTPGSTSLVPSDLESLVAILRQITRDAHVALSSVIACSLPVRRALYQQESASRIDLPRIGEALKSLNLGVVDAKQLAQKKGPAHFVADVIKRQSVNSGSDALILVGPKTIEESAASREIVDSLKELGRPVFYLCYVPDPVSNPWRDLLGNAVKQSHGFEYKITNPRDLFSAWADIVSRIAKSKTRPHD